MALNVGRRGRQPRAPETKTYEGGGAYLETPERELYLLACCSLFGGDQFYEKQSDRLARFRDLVAQTLARDAMRGPQFLAALAKYGRERMYLRTMPALLAAELFLGGAKHQKGDAYPVKWARDAANAAWLRGDEVLESVAYVRLVGSKFPKQFKLAVQDYLEAKLNESRAMKYKGEGRTFSLRDVVRLFHPHPKAGWKTALYRAVARGWGELTAEHKALLPRFSEVYEQGGTKTWEQTISKAGEKGEGVTAEDWEKAAEQMGLFATLRNLRNLVDAKVDEATLEKAAEQLTDVDQIRKAKLFPYRFYAAVRELPPYAPKILLDALATAMDLSADAIQPLEGKTAVIIDRSGSMNGGRFSKDSTINLETGAAVLGAMLNRISKADVFVFSDRVAFVRIPSGTPVMLATALILQIPGMGGGTNLGLALQTALPLSRYDTVIVLTDEQAHDWAMQPVIQHRPKAPGPWLFSINLAGYAPAAFDPKYPGIVRLGGFSDKVLEWIRMVQISDPVKAVIDWAYPAEVPALPAMAAD